jgi:predicted XRE-type DNA-binding protein
MPPCQSNWARVSARRGTGVGDIAASTRELPGNAMPRVNECVRSPSGPSRLHRSPWPEPLSEAITRSPYRKLGSVDRHIRWGAIACDDRVEPMRTNTLREHIGMEVKVAMLRSGVSQREFAQILGCAKSTLSAKLTGKTAFNVDELMSICVELGLNPANLFPPVESRRGQVCSRSDRSAQPQARP